MRAVNAVLEKRDFVLWTVTVITGLIKKLLQTLMMGY